ncbi:MAG: GNAT family N-acetyltransferase [Pseudomonadota bacterium]
MTSGWRIRPYHKDDADACGAVFAAAVETGAAGHYDAAQRRAWAARSAHEGFWPERLAKLTTVVATDMEKRIVGFASMRAEDGYLDLLFIDPGLRGRGLADELLRRLVDAALSLGLKRMTTHASLVARSFFARNGWQEDSRKTVDIGDVTLDNFLMSRDLSAISRQ